MTSTAIFATKQSSNRNGGLTQITSLVKKKYISYVTQPQLGRKGKNFLFLIDGTNHFEQKNGSMTCPENVPLFF